MYFKQDHNTVFIIIYSTVQFKQIKTVNRGIKSFLFIYVILFLLRLNVSNNNNIDKLKIKCEQK